MMHSEIAVVPSNHANLRVLARPKQNQPVAARTADDDGFAIAAVSAATAHAQPAMREGTRIFRRLVYTSAPAAFAGVC